MSTTKGNDPGHAGGRAGRGDIGGAAERYLGELEAQRRRLELIQQLQDAQREAIDNEDGEALVAIMGARERVIEEIRAAEAACESARATWTDAGAAESARARAAADMVRSLADAIVARDAGDERELLARSERLREELGQLGRKRDALGAYVPRKSGASPAYQDRSA